MKCALAKYVALVLLSVMAACSGKPNDALFIGTASNLQYAMIKLADEFEEETGIETQLLINSSGNITAQIEQGLPVDVFVSADMQYPMVLFRNGYGLDRPLVYAYGEIVLVSHDDAQPSFEAMLDEEVDKVAIANPKTAPYGQKARLALQNAGVWDTLQSKIVLGDNVSQANHFISSGAAEYGIIAKSLVVGAEKEGIAGWTAIPDSLYNPIMQGVLVIKHDALNQTDAEAFLQFMVSDKAKDILNAYGYRTSFGQ
jgi:molybdate transport system substrate-binding protein